PAPPTPHISTLSLHDALPISCDPRPGVERADQLPPDPGRTTGRAAGDRAVLRWRPLRAGGDRAAVAAPWDPALHARGGARAPAGDRKSTRLNSSHVAISYAVF